MRWIRKLLPFVPLIAGALLVVAGLAYDVVFAGIPYQDPPPALRGQYALHAAFASRIESVGGYVALIGAAVLLATWLARRLRRAR